MQLYTVHQTAMIGKRADIGANTVIQGGVVIGDDVEIGENVVICDGTVIGDHVSIGPNSVIGKRPIHNRRVKRKPAAVEPLIIHNDVVIGAGVVLYAGSLIHSDVLIGDLASIRENVEVGESTVVGRAVIVELNTTIGERVVLQTGSYITGDTTIEDDVFIGPEVSTSNDKYMGLIPFNYTGPYIEKLARIGNNATLLPGVRVGTRAIVGAGAVVTKDVAPQDTVAGVPATSIAKQEKRGASGHETDTSN